ncbi:hypothetical protein [Ekhidna sp.]
MQVIWYNTASQSYQYGTYEEFQIKLTVKPNEILGLERFRNTSERTLLKIVSELNKCQLSRLR